MTKISCVEMVKSPHGLDCMKSKNSKVYIPIVLADKVHNAAMELLPKMEKYSELSGHPIFFFPKSENATLMNYGAKTLYIDNNTSQKAIVESINNHINTVL